ncbi:MAG: hypothetical protein HY661_01745 [Betaproteobacteria bacterium]|nr:hypothetical protein [Betaproteobacteria bacterium]
MMVSPAAEAGHGEGEVERMRGSHGINGHTDAPTITVEQGFHRVHQREMNDNHDSEYEIEIRSRPDKAKV